MRIFLSYESEDRDLIEPIRFALAEQGHDIFYDREDLKPGEAFDSRIRAAIERAICLLLPDATHGRCGQLYAERAVGRRADVAARRRSRAAGHPRGCPAPGYSCLFPFRHCLTPVGNVTASVSDAVHQLARAHSRRHMRKLAVWAVAILIPVAIASYGSCSARQSRRRMA